MHQFEIKNVRRKLEHRNPKIIKRKNGTALKFNPIENLKTRVSLTKKRRLVKLAKTLSGSTVIAFEERDISIIAENKPHAHHKSHLHTMKVYNTRPVNLTIEGFLTKILSFYDTEVFTCSKVINVFKRQNSWTDPFQKSSSSFALIFPKLSSQNMHGALRGSQWG